MPLKLGGTFLARHLQYFWCSTGKVTWESVGDTGLFGKLRWPSGPNVTKARMVASPQTPCQPSDADLGAGTREVWGLPPG